MALLFDDASSEYLQNLAAPVTVNTQTFGCFFKTDDNTINQSIISVNNGTTSGYFNLRYLGATDDTVIARTRTDGASNLTAATTTTITDTNWHHVCAVFNGNSSRSVYLDGGGKGTDTSTDGGTTPDRIDIGRLYAATQHVSGSLEHVFVYEIALSDAEVAQLANRVSPLLVRRDSLVFYAPLLNQDYFDWVGGLDLTVGGTPTIDLNGAPVIWPRSAKIIPQPIAAAAGGTVVLKLAGDGGLAGPGGLAGRHGGLAG